jgi:hypothetical protein
MDLWSRQVPFIAYDPDKKNHFFMAEVTRHDHGKKLTALKKSNSSDSDILFFAKDRSKSHQGWSKLARQFSEKKLPIF